VLPAVSSLKALRRVAKPSAATKPMIGFGNPLLDGDPNEPFEVERATKAREWQSCRAMDGERSAVPMAARAGLRAVAHRGLAKIETIKRQLPLPETANELCAVARSLGVPESEIRLGSRASEGEVKGLSGSGALAAYRIVHFATHGALAGADVEPGLIL